MAALIAMPLRGRCSLTGAGAGLLSGIAGSAVRESDLLAGRGVGLVFCTDGDVMT